MPPRWTLSGTVLLLVVLAVSLELNLLGVTDFPFKTTDPSPRQERMTRVLRSAKSQCRFGKALVSAGAASGGGRSERVKPVSFARTYANSFAGTSADDRLQIRAACLQGLTNNGRAR